MQPYTTKVVGLQNSSQKKNTWKEIGLGLGKDTAEAQSLMQPRTSRPFNRKRRSIVAGIFPKRLAPSHHVVTGSVTGILRLFWHDNCGTRIRGFHLNHSTAIPGAWHMEDGRKLPPAALRLYGNHSSGLVPRGDKAPWLPHFFAK